MDSAAAAEVGVDKATGLAAGGPVPVRAGDAVPVVPVGPAVEVGAADSAAAAARSSRVPLSSLTV